MTVSTLAFLSERTFVYRQRKKSSEMGRKRRALGHTMGSSSAAGNTPRAPSANTAATDETSWHTRMKLGAGTCETASLLMTSSVAEHVP